MEQSIRVLGRNGLFDFTLLEIKSNNYTEYAVVVAYDTETKTWFQAKYFKNEVEARNYMEMF